MMFRLVILFLMAFVSACQGPPAIPDDTVVVGIEVYPEQLDPRFATDAMSAKIKQLVFSGLMDTDEHQNLVLDLASRYEVAEGRIYTFTLRQDVYFHDGRRLTSRDIKSTYESIRDAKLASPFYGSLKVIDKIDAPSDDKIIFTLSKPYLPFLTLMTLGILPEDLAGLGRLPPEKLMGTGPFRFAKKQPSREKVILERFDLYHADKPHLREIVFWVVQDNTLRSMELLKGRIDLVQNNIPFVLVPFFKERPQISFDERVGINMAYLAFNFKNPYLQDLRVRQAIASAIDRASIIRYKLRELANPATSVLSPDHWAFNHGLKSIPFDLAKARALLDQTPYKDPDGDGPATRFHIVYKTSTNRERLEIAQLIAENLRQIGIGVTVKPFEFGTFYRDIRQGDFDVFTLTWVGLSDPDIYYFIAASDQYPPNGMNRGYYKNPKLDELLVSSRGEYDLKRRSGLYNEIQDIFFKDLVYVPLWYEKNFVFMNHRLKGYHLRPDASFFGLVSAKKQKQND